MTNGDEAPGKSAVRRLAEWFLVGTGQFTLGVIISACGFVAFTIFPYVKHEVLEPRNPAKHVDGRLILEYVDFPVPFATSSQLGDTRMTEEEVQKLLATGEIAFPYLPLAVRIANLSSNNLTVDALLLVNESAEEEPAVKNPVGRGILHTRGGADVTNIFRIVDLVESQPTVNLLAEWERLDVHNRELALPEDLSPKTLKRTRLEIPPGEHEYLYILLRTYSHGPSFHNVSFKIVGHLGNTPFTAPLSTLWVPPGGSGGAPSIYRFGDFTSLRIYNSRRVTEQAFATAEDGSAIPKVTD